MQIFLILLFKLNAIVKTDVNSTVVKKIEITRIIFFKGFSFNLRNDK